MLFTFLYIFFKTKSRLPFFITCSLKMSKKKFVTQKRYEQTTLWLDSSYRWSVLYIQRKIIRTDDQRSIAVPRNGVIIDIYRTLPKELLFPWQSWEFQKSMQKNFMAFIFCSTGWLYMWLRFAFFWLQLGRDIFFHKHDGHKWRMKQSPRNYFHRFYLFRLKVCWMFS